MPRNLNLRVPISGPQLKTIYGISDQVVEKVMGKHSEVYFGSNNRGVRGWPLFGKAYDGVRDVFYGKLMGQKGKEKLERMYTKRQESEKMMTTYVEHCSETNGEGASICAALPRHDGTRENRTKMTDMRNVISAIGEADAAVSASNANIFFMNADGKIIDAIGAASPYETQSSLQRDVQLIDKRIRAIRFIAHPHQIEHIVEKATRFGRKTSPAEYAFAHSPEIQNEAWLLFTRQVAEKSGNEQCKNLLERAESGQMTGKGAYLQMISLLSPKEMSNISFDKVFVLDSKLRISGKFYNELHSITDYFGGHFKYWFTRAVNGEMTTLPGNRDNPDFKPAMGRVFGMEPKDKNATVSNEEVDARIGLADSNFAKVVGDRLKKMMGFYEVSADQLKYKKILGMRVPSINLEEIGQIPANIKNRVKKINDAYVKKMVPNAFYLQNLSTLKESLLLIVAGLGAIELFKRGVEAAAPFLTNLMAQISISPETAEKILGGLIVVAAGVGANYLNGIADKLSGVIKLIKNLIVKLVGGKTKTVDGAGIMQAKAEHFSGKALSEGIRGGFLAALTNFTLLTFTKGLWPLYFLFHATSGNFTTQTVSQVGVWHRLMKPVAKTLQKIGIMEKKVSASLEAWKEVNLNSIFRLYQTVMGSCALWITSFAIGAMGVIDHPAKYWWGAMALFLTAVLETPFAALGITIIEPIRAPLSMKKAIKKAAKE